MLITNTLDVPGVDGGMPRDSYTATVLYL